MIARHFAMSLVLRAGGHLPRPESAASQPGDIFGGASGRWYRKAGCGSRLCSGIKNFLGVLHVKWKRSFK